MSEKKDSNLLQLKQIAALTAVPVMLLVGPLGGYFIGNWVDTRFQCRPWGVILFLILGFVAAGREIFRLLKQVSNQEKIDHHPRNS